MNDYVTGRFEMNNIKYLKRRTNYIMVDSFRRQEDIYSEDLENDNTVLYENLYEIKKLGLFLFL